MQSLCNVIELGDLLFAGLDEEGLYRVVGVSSKVAKLSGLLLGMRLYALDTL